MMGEANRVSLQALPPIQQEGYKQQLYAGGKKDIEEEDYIYKVPCQARETISLRDSSYIS